MLEKLIAGFITLIVGASLLPVVANQVNFNRGLGLVGWEIDKEQEKPKRQTYLDYVKERLEVERLMKRW